MSLNPLAWHLPWPLVFTALFVIVMARANATYWLGRGVLAGAQHSRWRGRVESTGFHRAQRLLDRWGPPVVAVSFLTVGFQTVMNLAAGVGRMPLRHYLPAATVGAVLWALVYSTVGLISLHVWTLLWHRSPAVAVAVVLIAGGALAWFVVTRVRLHGATSETAAHDR